MTSAAGKFARSHFTPLATLARDLLYASIQAGSSGPQITAATLANIAGLSLALRSGATYAIEAWIVSVQTVTAGALGVSFSYSGGTSFFYQGATLNGNGVSTQQTTGAGQTAIVESSTRATGQLAATRLDGILVTTGTAGNLTLQAQISAGTNIIYGGWIRAAEV